MSKFIGDVSAYAYAVSKGYTGTEEEFAELMASYADVGQTAVDAKDAAVAAKTAAQTAATTATNKASEATTAATTATTKAGEASTSASTATSAKDTAVSASQTATSKAAEATTAAATATSAKTDAVAANTAAQSAKTAAQTAQAGAETAAASVQSSAAQIQTNADDISELKEDLTHAFPHDTASGAVASFTDGADDVPMDSVIVSIDPVQEGSGDPSPTNVRPILGWSEVNVGASGKNMLENTLTTGTHNGTTFTVNDDGSITVSGTPTALTRVPIKRGLVWDGRTDAVFSSGALPASCRIFARRIYKGASSYPTVSLTAILTLGAKYYDFFLEVNTNFTGEAFTVYPQLELGSTATAYEPYSGQSITIALGQTVYGGTLDVTKGELVIDRAMVDLETLDWEYVSSGGYFKTDITTKKYGNTNLICSSYKTTSSTTVGGMVSGEIKGNIDQRTICIKDSAYTDATAFKSAMSGVMLCYEVANPTTIQLTPHEVRSLLGSNNIWADTGDTEVTYRADPTLYISRLTEPDADMVADANITSGQYFMVGNTLYKATANIASGGAITPNVNCTRKSLSEALNEINA